MRAPSYAVAAAVVALAASLASSMPARAADAGWSPLRDAGDHAIAVALDEQTVALVSIGGPDEATIYDQRMLAGVPGPRSEVTTVDDVEGCRPVEAATSLGNLAVAVECHVQTGLEEPPTRLVELVWTGDDGWVWQVQPEGEIASIDFSPQGQYVLFATNSTYGRPHHLTSYHADLGWRDLRRKELGVTGDDLVAAVTDGGDVVALRGSGSEDEPGYWYGGRLRIETYDDLTGRWTVRHRQSYPDGGIAPGRVDLVRGHLVAAVVESRSTGRLDGRDDRVVLLSGTPGEPRLWAPARWSRDVLDVSAAASRGGVGTSAWLAVGARRTARPWVATWATSRQQPDVRRLGPRTSLTGGVAPGRLLDLSVGAEGHGVVARVHHARGAAGSTVVADTFAVSRRGRLRAQDRVAWEQPVDASVDVVAGTDAATLVIGRLSGFLVPAPVVQYAVQASAPDLTP